MIEEYRALYGLDAARLPGLERGADTEHPPAEEIVAYASSSRPKKRPMVRIQLLCQPPQPREQITRDSAIVAVETGVNGCDIVPRVWCGAVYRLGGPDSTRWRGWSACVTFRLRRFSDHERHRIRVR